MSPEQARGQASKVGPSADLWALGLIVYRLLTGKNYWSAEGMAALIGQILYEPMVPPSQMSPHLGPRFDAWFARACCREVEGRFSNAVEQIQALAMALGVNYAAQNTNLDMPNPMDLSASAQVRQAVAGMPMYGLSIPPGGSSMGGMSIPGTSIPAASISHAGMPMPLGIQNPAAISIAGVQAAQLAAMNLSQSGGVMPGGASGATTGAPLYSTQAGTPSPKKSRLGAILAASLVLIGLAGVGGLYFVLKGNEAKQAAAKAAATLPPAPLPSVAVAEVIPAPPVTAEPVLPAEPAASAAASAAPSAEPAASAAVAPDAPSAEPPTPPPAATTAEPVAAAPKTTPTTATTTTKTAAATTVAKPKSSTTVAPKVKGTIKF
jgi:serine/threonine-protein kinase